MAAGAAEVTSALLHPRLAPVYCGKIVRPFDEVEVESGRNETPVDGVVHAASKGDLATMLVLASRNEKSPKRWCA